MRTKKESTDEKIDNLAIMVAKGFDGVHKEIKQLKGEFDGLREDFDGLKGNFDGLREDFDGLRKDVSRTLENHIKDVRTDYDSLTSRVKHLEATQE